jgi:hypothetical protein
MGIKMKSLKRDEGISWKQEREISAESFGHSSGETFQIEGLSIPV